jgi:hypothetical protein
MKSHCRRRQQIKGLSLIKELVIKGLRVRGSRLSQADGLSKAELFLGCPNDYSDTCSAGWDCIGVRHGLWPHGCGLYRPKGRRLTLCAVISRPLRRYKAWWLAAMSEISSTICKPR